jgi:hypothetical protein
MTTYRKVRFTSYAGNTAGVIVESAKFDTMTTSDISRLFPYYEAPKMKVLQLSDEYSSWEAAFSHSFEKVNH